MNPFYFASAERPLFGVHHPPRSGTSGARGPGREVGPRGAVLCYPFGVEYMRAHRAFRQLTTLLTRAGFHVLRFDYFGTGDSSGMGEEATLRQWRTDVHDAIDELKESVGLERVTLVGLRLGGSLALEAARDRTDLQRAVLWDPVVSGLHYLDEILPSPPRANGSTPPTGSTVGVSGYPLPPALQAELRALDLTRISEPLPAVVDIVVSRDDPTFVELRDRLLGQGVETGYRVVPSAGDWAVGDAFGAALLPQGIVREVVERVAAGGGP